MKRNSKVLKLYSKKEGIGVLKQRRFLGYEKKFLPSVVECMHQGKLKKKYFQKHLKCQTFCPVGIIMYSNLVNPLTLS